MTWKPQQALVLAAGLGTRMRPLSDDRPKPMVELAGRPLIDHVLSRIADAGVPNAIINVHHHADVLEQHLENRQAAAPVIRVQDERAKLLDTGGGATRARTAFPDETFLIHNADSVWIEGVEANLDRLFASWRPDDMDALLLVSLAGASVGYSGRGDFMMMPDGRLSRRKPGTVVPFAFNGVSLAHPRLFEGAPDGPFSLNVLWDRAIEADRLYGVRAEGIWMHVGDPDALREAERCLSGELER
ncbi:MAG: nucleotidyltransferase family protein [Pseudomonadota bacterium]